LGSEALISAVVDRLKAQGRVIAETRTLAVRGHEPKLSQAERRLKSDLLETVRNGGTSPPEASELASMAGVRSTVVPELLALLRDEQRLIEISPNLYLDFDVEGELRRKVVQHLLQASTMTMADLRDVLGTTRKYAVPIGEHLDRIGLTRREGDIRRLNDSGLVPSDQSLASRELRPTTLP
jgi:selenocysteine-specific elongation factor